MKKVSYQAPFDIHGNLMHYPQTQYVTAPEAKWIEGKGYDIPTQHIQPDWREVVPFYATMTLDTGVTSGRSAKYINWTDEKGRRYPMFVADVVGLITSGIRIEDGKVSGLWVVCKRGENYGIKFYGKEEEK